MNHMTKTNLEYCILTYGRDIYSFCKHLAGQQQEAEDLYQDTFLKATERMGQIDFEQNPKSYLLSIAIRLWKNRKRKYAWRSRIAPTLSMTEKDPSLRERRAPSSLEGDYIRKEEALLVRGAVSRLPDKLKMPVLLYYMEDLPVSQIAQILKIPAGTVKSRLYHARKKLQKELEVVLDEEYR